jgi:hypothetical protein
MLDIERLRLRKRLGAPATLIDGVADTARIGHTCREPLLEAGGALQLALAAP